MTKESELYAAYLGRANRRPGGEIFLHSSDSLHFVATCERMKIAIIGIDGAHIDASGVMPHLDVIADYSPRKVTPWSIYQQQCNRSASHFLQHAVAAKGPEIWFSFVVLDSVEYADCLRELGPPI